MSTPIRFRKMNGLGNEILVVDLRGRREELGPAAARAIGRRDGQHFDQMMVLRDPERAGTDAFVGIFNIDGSEAEACGNGMRCVSWVVAQETGRRALKFETRAGVLEARVTDAGRIAVDIGVPRFGWREIPLARPFANTGAIALDGADGRGLGAASVVNVGNPHAVFWVSHLDAHDLRRLGPPLETHALFPARANISLAHVVGPRSIAVRTWERG
ncbi:MAG: diaminopimelate epimerase, partial [Hyphomicrobiaceae bacterium]|nr:diaminopimelate epimerase [Hyphomicrobiaceae bacterium]